jgi:hypothetical protein
VVVEDIDQNTRVTAARRRHPGAAAAEGRMGLGMAVDGAMQGDAARKVGRQAGRQRTLDPVADNAADDQRRVVAGQQGMARKFMARYYPAMTELLDGIELQTGDDPRFARDLDARPRRRRLRFRPRGAASRARGAPPAVRFVFPNAPQIPVTCNGGWVMPAWYDIISLAPDTREIDEQGVVRSRTRPQEQEIIDIRMAAVPPASADPAASAPKTSAATSSRPAAC